MIYQHFIAALAAAFLCYFGTITAQKANEPSILPTFEQLVADDAPQVYQLALNDKLNLDQLRFFLKYELIYERNHNYLLPLYNIYWGQLTHKDKLNFEHIKFIQELSHLNVQKEQSYQLSLSLAYVIQHKTEYKKVWGDSLYNRFILWGFNVECQDLDLVSYTEEIESLESRKEKAEKFIALIKPNLPEYENHIRSDIYCRCVYDYNTEEEQYYNAINEFLTKYETNPDNFNMYASDVIRSDVDIKYKQMGLVWINKAIELETDPCNVICKAELLYQLGRIDEAKNILIAVQPQIDKKEKWLKAYYQTTMKLINTAK